jgi:serine/threonine protein kinase
MAELQPGDLIGSFEVRRLLGKGGMGAVYLAHDPSLDREVAVKVLPNRLARDGAIVARFQREARSLAKLRHPNLMHIYTVGEYGGRPFFAMEYVRGSTLKSVIAKTGPLPPEQALHICGEVMSALAKVHKAEMVHRDIKPGNIMVDEDGRAVLMDFGLAREEQDLSLTADHTVLGTPSYMSPEQARGDRVDARTDIYSLGIVLYEMLAGAPPFKGKTSFELLRQHIEAAVPPLLEARPDLPAAYDSVVRAALAKPPGDRFQTVGQMAAALAEISPSATLIRTARETGDTAPTLISRRSTQAAPPERKPRGTWLWWAVTAAAVTLAALAAWSVFRPDPRPVGLVGHRVRIERKDASPVEGRLLSIEVLDDGTTTARIEAGEPGQPRTISIREGDELVVIDPR